MNRGSLREVAKNNRVVAGVLIAVIVVVAVILGFASPSKPWIIFLQVVSAVVGAALGNVLRLDVSQSTVTNQARPATRHLFDQVSRLRILVQRAEGYQVAIEATPEGGLVEPAEPPTGSSRWVGSYATRSTRPWPQSTIGVT